MPITTATSATTAPTPKVRPGPDPNQAAELKPALSCQYSARPESTVSTPAPMSHTCICREVSRCMTAPPAAPVARMLGMRKKAMNTTAPTQKTPTTM